MMDVKKRHYLAGVALIGLLVMLFATDPNHVSSIGLIIPFILLFVFLANLFLIYFERGDLSKSQQHRLAGLFAGLPCMLLVLRSVDQLTIRDAAILGGFFALSGFYVVRTARSTHP